MKIPSLFAIAGVGFLLWYLSTRSKTQNLTSTVLASPTTTSNPPAKPTPMDPANFSIVPELDAVTNTPITEAAYHQGSTDYVPAFGPLENQTDEEVYLLR
jgi:hypothetical protein